MMDPFKKLYQNWMKAELESPEVQSGKEAFLEKLFPPKPVPATGPFWTLPALRFAMVGCLALFAVFQVNILNHPTVSEINPLGTSVQQTQATDFNPAQDSNSSENTVKTQIKKIGSQVGPTLAYQKNFSDVQITVVWVFPKGA